jgi:tetratricopeptide (TPR) repeat protein
MKSAPGGHLLVLLMALTLAACATYEPVAKPGQQINVREVRSRVERGLTYDPSHGKAPWMVWPAGSVQGYVGNVKTLSDRLVLTTTEGHGVHIPYETMTIKFIGEYGPKGRILLSDVTIFYGIPLNVDLSPVADAIQALRQRSLEERTAEAALDARIEPYRNARNRPPIPEDSRRLRVQAEDAIQQKDFFAAADLYRDALTSAPWWAEGYYNRAAILAEIGDYAAATREMKRYLLLEPRAPEARELQDRIYQWERRSR